MNGNMGIVDNMYKHWLADIGKCFKRSQTKATVAYDYFEKNPEQTEISIVDNEGKFLGLMTRNNVMHAFGGRYGFTLHQRHHVIDMAKQETLVVHRDLTIENVSRLAMERKVNELYDWLWC